MTFPLDTPIQSYCDYITNLMDDMDAYRKLALSAYNEYQQRLNWKTAIKQFIALIEKHNDKSTHKK